MAGGCATFCTLMSGLAVPLMAFFGYLCSQQSPMIDIPDAQKADAGKGCFMAAFFYAVTFVVAYGSMKKAASAREIKVSASS
eukprot:CAMPEP_0115210040 /NCGR_PEP_ID=MMETSP0270-20121206/22043_1 /TAXON_ID=71861 /ORGANISM="Scrippsiella trochoidea, Strain CCMP3099" /LENGTH=81 /DNA_ID=CAMNT_0002623685 /DNA_START=76 /DNA_END=321 /DNA_ORIENTATION=-